MKATTKRNCLGSWEERAQSESQRETSEITWEKGRVWKPQTKIREQLLGKWAGELPVDSLYCLAPGDPSQLLFCALSFRHHRISLLFYLIVISAATRWTLSKVLTCGLWSPVPDFLLRW